MIDPNAIIHGRRNHKRGIMNRSKIIRYLRKNYVASSKELSRELNISYKSVYYHLTLLRNNNIVKKEGRLWKLSSYPQHTIEDYI